MDHIFWHTKTASEIFEELSSRASGLTSAEAKQRLEEFGPNKLPEGKPDGVVLIFIRQFQSPLIYILIVATLIVLYLGETFDAAIIAAVLLVNAIIGAVQEGRAQDALRALKSFSETSATVLRDGREVSVSDTEVVPGDIISFQEGERIPADARLISAESLRMDEASLTGESGPVEKLSGDAPGKRALIADQKNMIFKSTNVLRGNGTAIVVATGLRTEIGKIAEKIAESDTEIPLKANIRYLSNLIIGITLALAVFLIMLGLLRGEPLQEMFVIAVALSVSVIPEGLPIVMTLVLATGVHRMSKRNVLVKRLQAVEALGQTRIIAVDKTGTLTRNEMVLQRVYAGGKEFTVSGEGYEREGEVQYNGQTVTAAEYPELMISAKIAGYSATARVLYVEEEKKWKVSGDPTEAAIRTFAEKLGRHNEVVEREAPKVQEIPFDYREKYQATIRKDRGSNFLALSGAPERVLSLATSVWRSDGSPEPLVTEKRQELEAVLHRFAREGFRVVAYAMHEGVEDRVDIAALPPLVFVGFFGIRDALREEVHEAVARVRAAGMRVVMITGDHQLTALSIAREADIWREGDESLTGEEMERLSPEEFKERLARVTVFARVTPEHKLRIVEGFRARGETIAMTGDGVNDAPSLVAADLGVAMGKIGTDVAKGAADIVLLDDNFGNIVSAAEEGRGIYVTIKKVILYLFSTNVGEVLVIVGAILLGFPLPLLAAQIIWLNFVTDGFLVAALAMEPKEKGLLRGAFSRPKKWIIDGIMAKRMVLMALPMGIGTLYMFAQYLETDPAKALTISLTLLAIFQWLNVWNCRSDRESIFRTNPFSNLFLVAGTAVVIALQLFAVYAPVMQKFLHTVALGREEWFILVLIALSVIAVEEIRKFFYRRTLSTL